MNKNEWLDGWNSRYSNEEYAYGKSPNQFLKEQLEKLPKGSILFPAEGEGRNAVFAATLGWDVSAFDISDKGQKKAMHLAEENQVKIDYLVGELETLNYQEEQFDAIALIYAHFPSAIKSSLHNMLSAKLRKGGTIIFEAFSKSHLEYRNKNEKVGGPRELDMLFSTEEIQHDFPDFEISILEEKVIELHEGEFHNGEGSVIRFVGRKRGEF